MIRTGIPFLIEAAHLDPFHGERLHGHTWHGVAWWAGEPRRDARVLKHLVDTIAAHFDHRLLDDVIVDTTGEFLAATIGRLMDGCIGVRLERPTHIAEWWAD